ncbi:conjugal transfer protein TraF, partial [Pontiella sp.]|uniref:conjugal transfer protein TraF n=1 Tax=Pontiella sp. TaxID=2837462 RepID=UPI00356A1A62
EDMPEYMTMIGNIDFDTFDAGGLLADTDDAVRSMLSLGSAAIGLADNPDNAFYVDANAGMSMRIGRFGIGVRSFIEGAGFVEDLDLDNMGIEQTEGEFAAAINSAAASTSGFDAGTYSRKAYSQTQYDTLVAKIGDENAVKYLDYQLFRLSNEGEGLTEQNIDDSYTFVNSIDFNTPEGSANSLENNETVVAVRGFGLVEVPVSFGYAFNENLSIGITAKAMYGVVSGTKLWFFDEDATEDALDSASDNTEATLNFGLDLGVLYRMKMLQFAIVGHNLNGPKFDGFSDTIDLKNDNGDVIATKALKVSDYKIDPQVTIGAAFIPSPRFTLEVSYDLLETGTLLENYDIQRLSFGGEFDVWLLSLRLGAYNNLAADWMGWVGTGGVGVNLFGVRLDVGGAYSFQDTASYEDSDIPAEARLYAGLSFEF